MPRKQFVFLFNSTQYILEIPSTDPDKPSRAEEYDEGRLEIVTDSQKEIDPNEVQGSRPGGKMRSENYPGCLVNLHMLGLHG